jgi:hypothetical protein
MNTNEVELPPDFRAAVDKADEQCQDIVQRLVSAIETKSAPDLNSLSGDAKAIIGPHLNPLQHAAVTCVHEMTSNSKQFNLQVYFCRVPASRMHSKLHR